MQHNVMTHFRMDTHVQILREKLGKENNQQGSSQQSQQGPKGWSQDAVTSLVVQYRLLQSNPAQVPVDPSTGGGWGPVCMSCKHPCTYVPWATPCKLGAMTKCFDHMVIARTSNVEPKLLYMRQLSSMQRYATQLTRL